MNQTTTVPEFEEDIREGGRAANNVGWHVMVCFSVDRGIFYTDDRNRIADDGTIIVTAIGKDCQGYLYYVCPACGQIHYIHQTDAAGKNKKVRCSCTAYKQLDPDGEFKKPDARYIYLDVPPETKLC